MNDLFLIGSACLGSGLVGALGAYAVAVGKMRDLSDALDFSETANKRLRGERDDSNFQRDDAKSKLATSEDKVGKLTADLESIHAKLAAALAKKPVAQTKFAPKINIPQPAPKAPRKKSAAK